ncbi:MAG TPA: SBBP repeat-containing protein [Candidatus Dormibacteraeota bacterium]|nr:SBBP repeat-containing protein [Candidatus Dormibacteraeota bacterium]
MTARNLPVGAPLFGTPLGYRALTWMLAMLLAASVAWVLPLAPHRATPASNSNANSAVNAYGQLPLSFVANAGHDHPDVRFSAQAGAVSFWFTSTQAVFSFAGEHKGVNLGLGFLGANPAPAIEGTDPLAGKVNYFLGDDPSAWKTGLPTYGELVYRGLWPGIDLAFRGEAGTLKYEFRVAPGADVSNIRLEYRGADMLTLSPTGDLILSTAVGPITDAKPVSYQVVGGNRVPVESRYALEGNTYGFALGAYDTSRPVVIDPGLAYSTYLGGSGGDNGTGIAVDGLGNAYLTGQTSSANFPTTVGAFDTSANGNFDAFVTKLGPSGGAPLLYSTYLGGSSFDQGLGIAVDGLGNAYLTGQTSSANFPTTVGAFDTSANGNDAFVTKLGPSGSAPLLYSTYLGGSGFDQGNGIAVDGLGNAYLTGFTDSTNFPTTVGAFDTSYNGGVDAFVTKLGPSGSAPLLHSTYLGGSGGDNGTGIAVDGLGNAYLTGRTGSANFPTTVGAFDTSHNGGADAFVTKLVTAAVPATLVLTPATDVNPVGTSHTVTATVTDASGNPIPDVVVRFAVSGSVTASGQCTTDANGQCSFTYPGPEFPGEDAITAYADTDGDNTQDVGEPSGAATKTWVLPPSTPLCEVTISNGARITTLSGDTATFGGNAKVSSSSEEVRGEQQYTDHGPVQPLRVHSINVLAVVCSADRTEATLFGQATIDGSGSHFYRIRVKDGGEPGVGVDMYGILLETGYFSGDQTLEGGNVQITVHE